MKHPLDPYTYILVDRKPVQHDNDDNWFMWYGNMENRRVAADMVGEAFVSTIFGGIDRSYGRAPQPLVFETRIFEGEHDGWEKLASSWEEAEACHAEAMELVRKCSN